MTRRSEKLPHVKRKEWDRRNDATAKRRRVLAAGSLPDEEEDEAEGSEEDSGRTRQQRWGK